MISTGTYFRCVLCLRETCLLCCCWHIFKYLYSIDSVFASLLILPLELSFSFRNLVNLNPHNHCTTVRPGSTIQVLTKLKVLKPATIINQSNHILLKACFYIQRCQMCSWVSPYVFPYLMSVYSVLRSMNRNLLTSQSKIHVLNKNVLRNSTM